MKVNTVLALLVLSLLSACGDGGVTTTTNPNIVGNSITTPTTNSPPSTQAAATAPTLITGSTNYIFETSGNFTINQFQTTPNINVSGSGNRVEVVINQAIANLDIGGNDNTVIFRAGTSITSQINVGGTGNIVWLPSSMTLPLSTSKSMGNII